MADFFIVAVAVAALTGVPSQLILVVPAPPTVGFLIYPDVASCEQAAANLTVPAGSRLVCLPIEPRAGEMVSSH